MVHRLPMLVRLLMAHHRYPKAQRRAPKMQQGTLVSLHPMVALLAALQPMAVLPRMA